MYLYEKTLHTTYIHGKEIFYAQKVLTHFILTFVRVSTTVYSKWPKRRNSWNCQEM